MLSVTLFVLLVIHCVQPQCYQNCFNSNPCGTSSCGSYRPVSQCRNFPCYNNYNPYYIPLAYNNNQNYRVQNVRPQNIPYYGKYPNYNTFPVYQQPTDQIQKDPYANVPVEIIDDEDITNTRNIVNTNHQIQSQDEYSNIPVEIIDVEPQIPWKKNLPLLPKVNSHATYSVSQGQYSGASTVQTKPFQTTITRTLDPNQGNPDININVINGETVNEDLVATTIVPATEIVEEVVETTTEENEEPEPVSSWLGRK